MKFIASLACITPAVLLVGCGLNTVHMHDGQDLTPEREVTVSSLGIYPEKRLSLVIVEIDEKKVDQNRTAEFILSPGPHSIKITAKKDPSSAVTGSGLQYSVKKATLNTSLMAEPGHTYIPNAITHEDQIQIYLEDKGVGFDKKCIPLRRFAIAYGGSSDGKRAGCPD